VLVIFIEKEDNEMGCNCKWFEIIVAIVVILFAFLQGIAGLNMWVIVIAGVVLLLHAMKCSNCGACAPETGKKRKKK
jgi:hypothetical protein